MIIPRELLILLIQVAKGFHRWPERCFLKELPFFPDSQAISKRRMKVQETRTKHIRIHGNVHDRTKENAVNFPKMGVVNGQGWRKDLLGCFLRGKSKVHSEYVFISVNLKTCTCKGREFLNFLCESDTPNTRRNLILR